MRFRRRNSRFRDPVAAGRRSQEVQAQARVQRPLGARPPQPGTLLKTVRVTDHVIGASYAIEIRQGPRRNNVVASVLGREWAPMGFDRLFRRLRRSWKLAWLAED